MQMILKNKRAHLITRGAQALKLWFFLAILPAASIAAAGPMAQVKMTVDAVLLTLKDKNLPPDLRREKITGLIKERFDFRAMSQSTMALNWKKINDEEKDRFVSLFSRMLESSYMGRIEAYTDEVVEFSREKIDGRKAVVETYIKTGTADIPIRYKMIDRGDSWLVYDVVIEEVSLVRTHRSSFREIMSKEGFEGLIKQMEDKIKESDRTDQGGGGK